MFQDAYVKCDRLETEDLLDLFTPHLDGAPFAPATSVIMKRSLGFYPGYDFYDIADHSTMPARRRFVVRRQSDIVVLDFTNAPIYALNARAPLQLSQALLTDYVRFFFAFVRGRHGRFIICESLDDIQWRDDPAPAARKALSGMLAPLEILETLPDGGAILAASMMFKDTLFETRISVDGAGFVKLSEEKLLVEDMPVLDDTFGQ